MLNINLNNISKRDLSNQIANQIIKAIATGDLRKGDMLPSERTLSELLGISRGTVNKAYSYLKECKYIVARPGSHHCVTGIDSLEDAERDKGRACTEHYIDTLFKLNYSPSEIKALVNLSLIEREDGHERIKLALIECRPDAIYLFRKRLETIPNLELKFFLLDEILNLPSKVDEAMSYDIVITTSTHYFDVCKNLPQLEPKLVEVVTAWSETTIFQLATIPHNARIGIVYSSARTISLIQSALQYFNIKYDSLSAFNETNLKTFDDFCASRTVLIAEPPSVIFDENRRGQLLKDFIARGGKTIQFDHSIDKGSLLIIEQHILKVMNQKKIMSSADIK